MWTCENPDPVTLKVVLNKGPLSVGLGDATRNSVTTPGPSNGWQEVPSFGALSIHSSPTFTPVPRIPDAKLTLRACSVVVLYEKDR